MGKFSNFQQTGFTHTRKAMLGADPLLKYDA
jgi:hypothetical protein